MPMVLPCASVPIRALRFTSRSRRSARSASMIRLDNVKQHSERVLGDGMGIAAGLVDHQHAGFRAGLDVDRIEAGAIARDDQEAGRASQQVAVDVEVPRDFVARRADLIGMRRGDDRCGDMLGTFVLEPIETHIGPCLQDVGVDLMRQILDVENALVVDGH